MCPVSCTCRQASKSSLVYLTVEEMYITLDISYGLDYTQQVVSRKLTMLPSITNFINNYYGIFLGVILHTRVAVHTVGGCQVPSPCQNSLGELTTPLNYSHLELKFS